MNEFETYGPKALASIKDLPGDLRDRCVIVPLMKSRESFFDPDDDGDIWSEMRNQLYQFLIGSYTDVASEYIRRRAEYGLNAKIAGRTRELWLPMEAILRSCGVNEEMVLQVRTRFLQQYGFAEFEPSELETAVVQVILNAFGTENKIWLSPKEITTLLSSDLFPSKMTLSQMTTRVGWTIKNYNLSSDKRRSSEGVSYLLEKVRVDAVYARYFSTSPTSEAQNNATTGGLDDVGPPL